MDELRTGTALASARPLPSAAGFRLREWHATDAPALARAFSDTLIRRSVPNLPASPSIADGEAYVGRARAGTDAGTLIALAIAATDDDGAIGSISFSRTSPAQWFVGYWLAPERRGRGVATSALRLAVEWAFGSFPPLVRIGLFTRPDNAASQRVAERAGFVREGLLRRWHQSDGGLKDVVMFSFIRDDLG